MAGGVADRLGYMIAKVARHLDRRCEASAGAVDLPTEQWRVLDVLAERSGRSVGDLAQNAFVEVSTLSKMIDRMVADALVYRSPDPLDRRRVLIFVSDRGRARLAAIRPAVELQERLLARLLGDEGIAALRRLAAGITERGGGGDDAARPGGGPCRGETGASPGSA